MFRSTLRHTQPNCKVEFAKLTKFTFFYKLFGHIIEKQYFCTVKQKKHN